MTVIRARFDGRAFVPDQPVELPIGFEVRIAVEGVTPGTPRRLGSLKGTVRYMAPDFDAPLEDFKEYME